MRIAHVSDCYLPRVGGIEHQVHDLAVRQSEHGHAVQIITSVPGARSGLTDELIVWRPSPPRRAAPARIHYQSSLRGRDAVLAGKYDVVHLHASTWSPLTFLTAAATARHRIPTVITVHSLWAYAAPLFRYADLALHWRRWPLTWSAVSAAAAEPLQRLLGPDTDVAVLPNGVDAPTWRLPALSRSPGRVVIVSVGRLAERKRPRQLLRMLRQARALVPAAVRLEAVIVGDGPLRSRLQHYLDRHHMNGWVQLAGPGTHAQIRAVYQDADIYLAPARLESFGIAALEARCAALPVLAYAGTGIADFIRHDVEGLLARNDQDMITNIVHLATSSALLTRLREANTDTTPPITWPDVLERCQALYEQARNRPAEHQVRSTRARVG